MLPLHENENYLSIIDWPYDYILYLCCPNPVTAHVDDIIKAAGDLVIPLLRAIGAITSKEVTFWHKDLETLQKQESDS